MTATSTSQPDTDIAAAFAAATAPGQPYEVINQLIDGVEFRVFKNAPVNLRALYANGLDFAQRDFFVYEDERDTYAQAWQKAADVACALEKLGVQKGDRVGIALRNYPEWVHAFMGITSMGAIAVAMNAWWSGEELVYGIEDSGLKLLIADGERVERLLPHLDALDLQLVTVRSQHPGLKTWEDFLDGCADSEMTDAEIAADDNALILYTSGSTSHPKGVLSTHRAIIHALLGWEARRCGVQLLFPDSGCR